MKTSITVAVIAVGSALALSTMKATAPPPATVPPGTVVAFAGEVVPAGWLLCDGRALDRDLPVNKPLFDAILQSHGNGTAGPGATPKTDFNLPDYRGRFLRGVDRGTGRDPDVDNRTAAAAGGKTKNAVGSVQDWSTAMPRNAITVTGGAHSHGLPFEIRATEDSKSDGGSDRPNPAGVPRASSTNTDGAHTHTVNGGDSETRPTNAYVNFIIKR